MVTMATYSTLIWSLGVNSPQEVMGWCPIKPTGCRTGVLGWDGTGPEGWTGGTASPGASKSTDQSS